MGGVPYVSLFSGAGGLDIGMGLAGFSPALCVDSDSCCVATLRANLPGVPTVEGDLSRLSGAEVLAVAGLGRCPPVLVGGPPCQAFSSIGRRQGTADPRGRLVFHFARLVRELGPDAFVMENVRGLLSMPLAKGGGKGSLLEELLSVMRADGYRVDGFVVNAVNYGCPQIRERVFLVGNRVGGKAAFASPMHSNRPADGLPPFRTLGDAIGPGFVDSDPDIMDFSPRKLKYLGMVPPGGNWRSMPVEVQKESMGKAWGLKGGRSATWRRLSFKHPCPTVVTMPNHMTTSMCHPAETRALTVGECAAVQGFPPWWRFQGKVVDKYRQVGNAVPVDLARQAALSAASLLADARGEEPAEGGGEITHIRPHVRTTTYWKAGTAYAGGKDYYGED